jgi:integrase
LNELTVQKAKPQHRTYLVWDSYQRGLALQVQPTGSKAWKCIYSRHGRPRWLHLGAADVVDLAKARLLAGKALLAVAEGGDPAADKSAERAIGSFADLHAKYLEQHAKKRNRSWAQADALMRNHVLPRWGKLPAKSISRSDLKALIARISVGTPVAANATLAAISAVFSWAVEEELMPANPCRGVARNPMKARERILSDSELLRFWKALDQIDPVKAAALRTILLSGQRPGEVSWMRREQIKDGWWNMPGGPIRGIWCGTKNGDSNRVWMSGPVQKIIAQQLDGREAASGFVFVGGRGAQVNGLDRVARAACAVAGIERTTPHDLRRTFGSTVTRLGFGRQSMDRILNHADRSVGSVYDRHSYSAEDQRIMEACGAHIMSLVEGRAEDAKVIPFGR